MKRGTKRFCPQCGHEVVIGKNNQKHLANQADADGFCIGFKQGCIKVIGCSERLRRFNPKTGQRLDGYKPPHITVDPWNQIS